MTRPEYNGRQFCLILPSRADLLQWHADALDVGLPLNRYVYEMVEKAREIPLGPNPDVLREAAQSREELARLRRELKDATAARQKLETEIFALKGSLFLQPTPEGRSSLSSELIDLLQDGHVWRSAEIMAALNIDSKNIDAIKVLAGQLHALSDLKMIEETAKGWSWL
jgi:hypothetical protein